MHIPPKPRLIWARDTAAARPVPAPASTPRPAEIIDFRTGKPWRKPEAPSWLFLLDVAFTFLVVLLGSWLFRKMRGG